MTTQKRLDLLKTLRVARLSVFCGPIVALLVDYAIKRPGLRDMIFIVSGFAVAAGFGAPILRKG